MNDYETRMYIAGEWLADADNGTLPVRNPATGEVLANIQFGGRAAAVKALDAAAAAFDSWRAVTGQERGRYLQQVADLMRARQDDFARIITLENGKPLAQARGEVGGTIDHLEWFAGEARRTYGRMVPHQQQGKRHWVLKHPVGVTAAISPWNFPLILILRKIGPALAVGCPVVIKPARQTPLSAMALVSLFDEVGIPAGVVNLVTGPSDEIAAEFLENPICRKITFTGSTEVGRILMRGAAAQIKSLSLELGGQAPCIVCDDANLDLAVEGVLIAKFRNTGQSCIAANRVYVQEGIYSRFMERFVARAQELKVGNGLEDGVEIGPLIDEPALEKTLSHVEDAKAAGATVCCGAARLTGGDLAKGAFLAPTVLTEISSAMKCMTEETFGPVAPVDTFTDLDDVIARANSTVYGLAAYAFTQNLTTVYRLAEGLEAGSIGINDGNPAVSPCPFGGFKQSGLGRELGIEGVEAFLETKHISIVLP